MLFYFYTLQIKYCDVQVLNAPENCCGLKEKTVLKIASDVGEGFCNLVGYCSMRTIMKTLVFMEAQIAKR